MSLAEPAIDYVNPATFSRLESNQLSDSNSSTLPKTTKKTTLTHELKERISTQLETTTGHGCPNLVRTKYCAVRLMWIFLVLVATGASAYMVYRAISTYLKYEVTTQISTVREIPTPFPMVTICNINPLVQGKTALTEYLTSINRTEFLNQTYLDLQYEIDANNTDYYYYDYYDDAAYAQNNQTSVIDQYKEIKQNFLNLATQFNESDKKSLGYAIEDILVSCSYNSRRCIPQDFNWYYSYEYGNCFRFNTGVNQTTGQSVKIKEARRSGIHNGLYVELFIGESVDSYSFKSDFGAVAFINLDANTRPESERALKMKAGTLSDVVIHKTSYKRAYTPVSECKDFTKYWFDRLFYNAITMANYSYSQSLCFDVCLQQKIVDKCVCYDLQYLPRGDLVKPCLNQTEIRCASLEYASFIESDIKADCEPRCPLECETSELDSYVTTSSFPSSDYAQIIKNFATVKQHYDDGYQITQDDLSLNVLALNVYFNDLEYTQIEESVKNDIVDLVANIGGTVGVFVGISILSFAEFVEFLVEVCIIFYKRKTKKKKTSNV